MYSFVDCHSRGGVLRTSDKLFPTDRRSGGTAEEQTCTWAAAVVIRLQRRTSDSDVVMRFIHRRFQPQRKMLSEARNYNSRVCGGQSRDSLEGRLTLDG